jgi:hypothetical protein
MEREQEHDPIVVAIERVLEAERAAERHLQECRQQANALVTAARERAAAIIRRADARIAKMHTAYLSKVSAEIAVLSHPSASGGEDRAFDDAELAAAAQRLAAKLTGAT